MGQKPHQQENKNTTHVAQYVLKPSSAIRDWNINPNGPQHGQRAHIPLLILMRKPLKTAENR
jgi:ribosomal protein S4E